MKKEELLKIGLTEEQADIIVQMNEENIGKIKIEMGVRDALLKHKVKNIKTVLPLIDFDKIKNGEEGIFGIDEQIKELKNSEDTAFLFEDDKVTGAKAEESGNGGKKPKNGKMTYTQMCRLI
ncbi:MAG: hypothetical protein HFE59_09050 [Clostridiales bacterium]|nr:hypothetical protein [Clostridiales bacterium]